MTIGVHASHDNGVSQDARQAMVLADNALATLSAMPQEEQVAALIECSLGGEHAAFAMLVEWYASAVYNLAYRMLGSPQDAEDASQETFLRAYLNLARFDRSRRFKTWLLSIASNYCIDRLRQRRGIWLSLDAVEFALGSEAQEPEEQILIGEEQRLVQRALHRLPAEYRLLALLRYWHDLSYAEIEQVTGLRETTIKSRLHRTRRILAQTLEPDLLHSRRPQVAVA